MISLKFVGVHFALCNFCSKLFMTNVYTCIVVTLKYASPLTWIPFASNLLALHRVATLCYDELGQVRMKLIVKFYVLWI